MHLHRVSRNLKNIHVYRWEGAKNLKNNNSQSCKQVIFLLEFVNIVLYM